MRYLHLLLLFVLVFSGCALSLLYRQFMGASSSSSMSHPLVIQPKEKATASLIFLHGLGDSGHGWGELFRDLAFKNIRCVFPHATSKPVTLNGGMQMPSWFDIKGLSMNIPEDEQGVKDAAKDLQGLVAQEVSSGIPAGRVFIGGFSQGGSVALYTAFGTNTKIGGVLALSAWIPINKHFKDPNTTKYNTDVPMLQCHGQVDGVIPHLYGQATNGIIQTFNPTSQFKSYGGLGHSSSPQEMKDIKDFLENHLTDS